MIPERIITRAPSAELRADQIDQDSLPPYDALDGILEAYVEHDRSPAEIVAMGFAPEHVRQVVRLIKINEYKRRQAAVGIRITPRGFGRDWRYPITSAWHEWEDVARAARSAPRTRRPPWCKLRRDPIRRSPPTGLPPP